MRRRPDFLYIGTSKAGSTWVFSVLSWHPKIYAYPGKNLGFFSTRFQKGWTWYLDQFDPGPDHQAVGEVSHSYLVSEEAPSRIRDLLPEAKMLVVLRDPVQRSFSDYLDGVKNGKLNGTFEEELDRSPGLINRSRYGTQVARYLQHFGREQFHIVAFDELVADPAGFAAGIFRFLRVEELKIPATLRQRVLPAGVPRSRVLAAAVKPVSRAARRIGLTALRGKVKISPTIRNLLYRPFRDDRPAIRPETEARLRAIFADEVRLLDEVAGTDFATLWGYSSGATTAPPTTAAHVAERIAASDKQDPQWRTS
jgi:hypothetical protein